MRRAIKKRGIVRLPTPMREPRVEAFTVLGARLKRALGAVVPALATFDRPPLMDVMVTVDATHATLEATDGHRMHRVRMPVDGATPGLYLLSSLRAKDLVAYVGRRPSGLPCVVTLPRGVHPVNRDTLERLGRPASPSATTPHVVLSPSLIADVYRAAKVLGCASVKTSTWAIDEAVVVTGAADDASFKAVVMPMRADSHREAT